MLTGGNTMMLSEKNPTLLISSFRLNYDGSVFIYIDFIQA